LISSVSYGQVADKTQRTFIHERTADWCPLCGGWGWNFKDQVIDFTKNKSAIFAAIHHSGGLSNATSTALSTNFGSGGQPRFFVDGTDINVGSATQAKGISDISAIYEFNTSVEAFAGVVLEATLNPNTKILNVKANVEFFSEVTGGDYYLGLYLLENVINPQSGRPANTLHQNVLTKSFYTDPFGTSLKSGIIANGEKFGLEANLTNVNTPPADMKVLGVIWNRSNNKYLYFNANLASVSINTASKDIELFSDMNAYQTESGAIQVSLNADGVHKNSQLKLTDMTGKVIYVKNGLDIKEGSNQFTIPTQSQTGIYLVSVVNGASIQTTKIIVQ